MTPITALGSRYGIQGALGRSVKRASTASTWWDLNGTITSCVAAYQPKGAASYAASLVNLTGDTDYDATEAVGTVSWDSTNGWNGDGTNYLQAAIALSTAPTMIIKYAGWNNFYYTGFFGSSARTFDLGGRYNDPRQRIGATDYYAGSNTRANGSHVEAMAGSIFYIDSTGYDTGSTNSASGSSINILYSMLISHTPFRTGMSCQAFAVYSAALTSSQISDLTDAMNLL